jgi:hypothetical protein
MEGLTASQEVVHPSQTIIEDFIDGRVENSPSESIAATIDQTRILIFSST